jgi:predicted nucleotidyltransferase
MFPGPGAEQAPPSRAELLAALRQAISPRPQIAAAYLYGSVVAERMTGLSDVDVAVLFAHGVDDVERRLIASDVAGELARLVHGREIDLRDLEALPLVVQGRVLGEGVLAGANDPVRRVRFETDTRMRYFDFLPFHRIDVAEGLKGLRRKLTGG